MLRTLLLSASSFSPKLHHYLCPPFATSSMSPPTDHSFTEQSSKPSENISHDHQGSKATTPSAATGYKDREDSAPTEHPAREVGSQGFSHGDAEESSEDVQNSQVPDPQSKNIARKLRSIGRTVRTSRRTQSMDYVEFSDTLTKHIQMMEWVSNNLLEVESPSDSSDEGEPERIIATPQLRQMNWKEWSQMSWTVISDHSAICILSGDAPIRRTIRQRGHFGRPSYIVPHTGPASCQAPRPNGLKTLPSQLRVLSLPIKRTLNNITSGKLYAEGARTQILLRPFKALVYFEDEIRKRLSDMKRLCDNHTKGSGTPETPADPGSVENNASNKADSFPVAESVLFTKMSDWARLTLNQRQEASRDFEVLVSFMDDYISPLRNALRSPDDNQVYFHEMWHLFSPGTMIYVKDSAVPQKIWRVVQGTGGRKPLAILEDDAKRLEFGTIFKQERSDPFKLDCFYIDFDGFRFVRVMKVFELEEFEDLQSVHSLPILPLNVAERLGMIDRNAAMENGREFISFTKASYCHYSGRSLCYAPEGGVLRQPESGHMGSVAVLPEVIESPVVVDFERCLQVIPDWKPGRVSHELSKSPEHEVSDGASSVNFEDDRVWDVRMAEKILSQTKLYQPLEQHGTTPPSGDDVLLLPDRVFAFVLRTRRWTCLPMGVDKFGPQGHKLRLMKPDYSAWDYLEIDQRHRSVIESLMATHFRKKKSGRRHFDLIQDKGKGLIILLHGVPGVGKTSTAETVAQYYNKPLLPITCGDLGTTPFEVESQLQSSFQLAQAWECVLLLDEADVFLAERSQDNIERNALVSVFLRVMEYYEGILFLTTNKVGSFDEAFKSRMSMALYYPPLKEAQTERIWSMQIDRTEKLSVEDAPNDESSHVKFNRHDVMAFAKELWGLQQSRQDYRPVWNGRHIRNAFQTAVALAEWHQRAENIPGPVYVKREHFEKVALVSMEFNSYLWSVKHSRGDDVLNLKKEHRYDNFDRIQASQGFGQGLSQGSSGFGGLGGWHASLQSNVMPQANQSGGMGMGMPSWYGNNMQNQGGIPASQSWQPVSSGMGNNGIGNMRMGMGMQPGAANLQGTSNQDMSGQTAEQQQQQQQLNVSQGGLPRPSF